MLNEISRGANPVKKRTLKYHGIIAMVGLLLASTSHAFNFGNMMNPSKWMGNSGDNDRYDRRDYPGYGYGGPGWGYPGYGYGGPGWGYPGYGYGAPGWGGYPGYGYGAPAYGAGAAQQSAPQHEVQ
jgi:hypothetical protein